MFAAGEACFSPSTVRTSTCWPPSPCKGKGSRGTPTGSGLSFRPSPDRITGSTEARANSTANAAAHRIACLPDQAYNLCLSEMRHYLDDDTMVLVLSQRAGAVQEAEYPVPLEQDTSEILDAEDDDVLAGYAEAASKLLKPNALSQLAGSGLHDSMVSPVQLFKYDDVSHERFDSQTYEAPAKQKREKANASSDSSRRKKKDACTIIIPDDNEHEADASPHSSRALFSSTEPDPGPSTWSPDQAVVDDQPWMKPPATSNSKSSKGSSSAAGHRLHHESHPSSAVRVSNGATPPKHSKSSSTGPKPFFSSAPSNRAADSSTAGASTAPPRHPHDSFGHTGPQHPHTFHPSSPVPPRVSNGARPKVNNGMSKKSSRAQVRERRAAERTQKDTESPTEPVSPTDPVLPPSNDATPASHPTSDNAKAQGFWDSAPQPMESPVDRDADRLQGSQSAHPAQPALPFFPKPAPGSSPSASARAQFEWSKPKGVRDFFDESPTYSASAPTQPLPSYFKGHAVGGNSAVQNGSVNARAKVPAQPSRTVDPPAASAHHHQHQHTESLAAPNVAPPTTSTSRHGYVDSDVDTAETADELDTKDHKGTHVQDEHHDASRSFARAVSISSLETVIPEHSIRGRNSPRNSAMRRSSRRDAHMKARIATLDTSNLSAYSSGTLRRLAKDLGLSNTYKLSKSELVVQLVSEIILANMSLGWGVPEVSQGALGEDQEDEGYTSSDDEDATVYRFAGRIGHQREVSVEEAVPHAALQRGRDTVERLTLEHVVDHAATATAGGSRAQGGGGTSLPQVDVDSDFEDMSKLSMTELQQMCEDMKIGGWARMRKFEMISRLLMDVYEIEK